MLRSPPNLEDPLWGYHYFRNSVYQFGVERFEAHFDAVKVVLFERLLQSPESVLEEIFAFCGLNSERVRPVLEHENPTRIPTALGRIYADVRDKHPLLAQTVDTLREGVRSVFDTAGKGGFMNWARSAFWSNPELPESLYDKSRNLLEAEYRYWEKRKPSTDSIWTYNH